MRCGKRREVMPISCKKYLLVWAEAGYDIDLDIKTCLYVKEYKSKKKAMEGIRKEVSLYSSSSKVLEFDKSTGEIKIIYFSK